MSGLMNRRALLGRVAGGFVAGSLMGAGTADGWLPAAWGQDQPPVRTTRNIIRKKLASNVQAVALEYTILLVKQGKETPVDPVNYRFMVGDQFLIRIHPKDNMYIYIFNEGPKGDRECLLPTQQEKPPFAEKDKPIELPGDGTFEFSTPPGDEKLIVVATTEPSKDLQALANVVFRKDPATLTAEEKALRERILGQVEKRLQSSEKERLAGAKTRGVLSDPRVDEFLKEVAVKKRGVIEEPPTGSDKSTFAMAVAAKEAGKPELLIQISLKSVDSDKKSGT